MKTRPIRTYGDPVLEKKARAVRLPVSERVRKMISEMFETMDEESGAGLAATQIGELLRVVVVDTQKEGQRIALINPRIVGQSEELSEFNEGCLSIPGVEGVVVRPLTVKVRGLTPDGRQVEITDNDLFARVIQHEIDHLNGVLFVDRLDEESRRRVEDDLERVKRGKKVSEGVAVTKN